jgi:predicted MFS family arabinose efflux permease
LLQTPGIAIIAITPVGSLLVAGLGMLVGAPLGGLLAESLGYRPALRLCAGGVAVAGLALLASPFRTVR